MDGDFTDEKLEKLFERSSQYEKRKICTIFKSFIGKTSIFNFKIFDVKPSIGSLNTKGFSLLSPNDFETLEEFLPFDSFKMNDKIPFIENTFCFSLARNSNSNGNSDPDFVLCTLSEKFKLFEIKILILFFFFVINALILFKCN